MENVFVHCNPATSSLVMPGRTYRRSCRARFAAPLLLLPLLLWTTPAVRGGESPFQFTEMVGASGIDFRHTIGDDKMDNIVESSGVGCALLDYDGDGWLDLYFVNGMYVAGLNDPQVAGRERLAAASDRLYRNRGDGTFEDVTLQAGIQPGGYGMGVLAVDYDNDGRCDIYVTNYGVNRLYRNLGGGRFEEAAETLGLADPLFSIGATALDFDRDGRLDFYVGNYLDYEPAIKSTVTPFPGPDAYRGQPNRLYRNEGARFRDVTAGSGLDQALGRTMGVSSFDYDDDGLIDLFVANDAMENHVFQNMGNGQFEEVALLSGLAYAANGEITGAMGAEVGDLDGDGRLDLFVPDYSNTCLYRNAGMGLFEDVSRRANVANACGKYVSWGAVLADFNLDTHVDLYVATGDAFELKGYPDLIFSNDGRANFTEVSAASGIHAGPPRVSRGVVAGDVDNDGDIDLVITHLNGPPSVLRNDTPRQGRHWLALKLIGNGRTCSRDPIGARVVCTPAGERTRPQIRELRSNGSYASTHDARLHFGLGTADTAAVVQIQWPDGSQQTLRDVRGDQLITVEQP